MNPGYTFGLIPGILGDVFGSDSLNGYEGDPNYQEDTRPIKGGDGNPLVDELMPIKIREGDRMYVFDAYGNYLTDFSMDEYGEDGIMRTDGRDDAVQVPDGQIYYDENGELVYERFYEPETATPNVTPGRDQYGNLIYVDSNGNIIEPEINVPSNQDPVLDENGNWVFIDQNGNTVYPDSYMDGNANTIVVHPTTREPIYVDELINPEYSVPTSAPMTDYAGNTFFTDANGNYVDANGNPFEPVLTPPTVDFTDELGNQVIPDEPSNDQSSNNQNTTPNDGYVDEMGDPIPGLNNNQNSSGVTDELGNQIPGISDNQNSSGDNVINEPPELDSEDEDNYIPTNKPTVKYEKPTNYNSTIGSRAAYYAP